MPTTKGLADGIVLEYKDFVVRYDGGIYAVCKVGKCVYSTGTVDAVYEAIDELTTHLVGDH